jgi:hypothetical protein
MKNKLSWAISDNNVTVNFEGKTHIVPRTDQLANDLIKALKENRLADIPKLISVAKRIEEMSKGEFVVKDGSILIDGFAAPKPLSDKIIKFSNMGLPFQPLLKFATKIQGNPSYRAVNELYSFLEKNDHPITESGNFIAYKRVRKDFKDIYTGTMDNSVGNVVEMPRNQVNEDANQTCSYGLHVANWHYAHTLYGTGTDMANEIMLEVEVNPADVVAVPIDYDNAKMRVCKYKVLGVVDSENSSDVALKYTGPDYSNVANDDDDEGCGDNDCVGCYPDDDDYPFDDELEDDDLNSES